VTNDLLADIPGERATLDSIRSELDRLKALETAFDSLPCFVLLLNRHRQVVFANRSFLEFVGRADAASLGGERPGELMGCVNARRDPVGCGASPNCRVCLLLRTVIESVAERRRVRRECRITLQDGMRDHAYDLDVTAAPFSVEGSSYTLLTIHDISEERRRRVLERIFFHDLINLAGGLQGILEVVNAIGDETRRNRFLRDAEALTANLLDEIQSQRDLLAAESGDLQPVVTVFEAAEAVELAIRQIRYHQAASDRIIEIAPDSESCRVRSDIRLLVRVLVNMLKNALESTARNGTVRIGFGPSGCGGCRFTVRNAGFIPPEIQLQIFQRSFSTKGVNRGTGTYSMKLLVERYLSGVVSFVSTPSDGTVFTVELPPDPGPR
jgi:signal transduction histidine kinase